MKQKKESIYEEYFYLLNFFRVLWKIKQRLDQEKVNN